MVKKTLDFNTLDRPELEITMPDPDKTVFRLTLPSEKVVEEMQAASAHLSEIADGGASADIVESIYALAAKMISSNRAGIQVTGLDLRERYNLDLEALVIFFYTFTEFVTDVAKQKN